MIRIRRYSLSGTYTAFDRFACGLNQIDFTLAAKTDSRFALSHPQARSQPNQVLCTRPNPETWSRPLFWSDLRNLEIGDERVRISRLWLNDWMSWQPSKTARNQKTKAGLPLMYSTVSSSTRFKSLSNPLRMPVTSRPPWNLTLMFCCIYLVRSTIDSFFFCWGAVCWCCCAGLAGFLFGGDDKIELDR